MNILTINNKNIVGYNIYEFILYYAKQIGYSIDKEEDGFLFIYEQFFPFQMLEVLTERKENVINFLKERINYLYELSSSKLHITKKIVFFYPFTFYSKYDYDFNILSFIKNEIESKFKKEIFFVLNNYYMDDNYFHFSAFRYDIFNKAREIKKIKSNDKKEKIFISINAKTRRHRDDLENFININNIKDDFYFSYIQKNHHLWQTNDYTEFGQKYLKNENNSGHKAFEFYLNDDFFNTKYGYFFDKSFYYIITETSCRDDLCFISEKTYKAFYHKIPFIIIGNPFTLKNLQNEGFKTFNKWIDESYDNEIDYQKRINKIFNEILRLKNLNNHYQILNEMQETLEYNSNHFLSTNSIKNDFLRIFK
jgi:hypothetical protein